MTLPEQSFDQLVAAVREVVREMAEQWERLGPSGRRLHDGLSAALIDHATARAQAKLDTLDTSCDPIEREIARLELDAAMEPGWRGGDDVAF
jgi:phage shock protein A